MTAIAEKKPALARSVVSALGWLPVDRAHAFIEQFTTSDSMLLRRIGVGAAAVHRIHPGDVPRGEPRPPQSFAAHEPSAARRWRAGAAAVDTSTHAAFRGRRRRRALLGRVVCGAARRAIGGPGAGGICR